MKVLKTGQGKDVRLQDDYRRTEDIADSPSVSRTSNLYTGLPKQTMRKLQLFQNATARTKTKKYEHITPILKSLHWLPVGQRIYFKIMLLTYKS